jgi:hypothetical protein
VHSSWSYDGSWTLESLADAFAERGCGVLLMTEHDRGFSESRWAEYRQACTRASNDRICVVPGLEYSDGDNRVHVLVWGSVPFLGENLPTAVMLEGVARHGGVAVLAHPTRRAAWECFRPEWGTRLLGVEIWNRKYDGWAPAARAVELAQHGSAVPFVGLDFHTRRQMFPLAMELGVVGAITEETVVDSLRGKRIAAKAFGLSLDGHRFERRRRFLSLAEHGRRRLARLKRYSRLALRG